MNQAIVSDDLPAVIALEKNGIAIGDYDFLCAGRSGCMNVISYLHAAGYDLKHTLVGACCSDFIGFNYTCSDSTCSDSTQSCRQKNTWAKDTVTWLIDHGVAPSAEALEQTIMSEDRELFDFLISSGADWTDSGVFAAACSISDDYFVRTLVSKGANINSSCPVDGGNGLNLASATRNVKVLEYLKSLGLPSIPDNHGKYPEEYMIPA